MFDFLLNVGVTTDVVVQRDARRGSKWSGAEPTRICWWSPTRRSTTIHGRLKETLSPAPRDLSRPRPPPARPHTRKKSRRKSARTTRLRLHLRCHRRTPPPWKRRRIKNSTTATTTTTTSWKWATSKRSLMMGFRRATSPHCRNPIFTPARTASSPIWARSRPTHWICCSRKDLMGATARVWIHSPSTIGLAQGVAAAAAAPPLAARPRGIREMIIESQTEAPTQFLSVQLRSMHDCQCE